MKKVVLSGHYISFDNIENAKKLLNECEEDLELIQEFSIDVFNDVTLRLNVVGDEEAIKRYFDFCSVHSDINK